MPRRPKTAKERTERRIAKAKTKRLAKTRERAAKAKGVVLDRDETVRQKRLEGIDPRLWKAFLAGLKRREDGKFSKT